MTRAERTQSIIVKCCEYEKTVLNNAERGIDAILLAMSKPPAERVSFSLEMEGRLMER
jgi:hypothetical protein